MKQYIVEMCNDFEERCKKLGRKEEARRIVRIRNDYIAADLSEIEAIQSVLYAVYLADKAIDEQNKKEAETGC